MLALENGEKTLEKVTPGKKVAVYDEVISDILEKQNITYIFAAYSENNKLLFAKYENVQIVPSNISQKVFEFTVPEMSGDVSYYRLFRWSGLDGMKPVK